MATYSKELVGGEKVVVAGETRGQVSIKFSPSKLAVFRGFDWESRHQAAASAIEGSVVNKCRLVPSAKWTRRQQH